ncbi:MAG: sigma-70 family RNA polymerase sigma factor [Planctomycetota bacterium]
MMQATMQKTGSGQKKVPSYLKGLSRLERQLYHRIPEEMDYVPHEEFDSPQAEDALFGPESPRIEIPVWTHFPDDAAEISSAPRRSRLTAAEERTMFKRYNYARYRLAGLIEAQNRRRIASRSREMVHWYRRAMHTRSELVRANMALVLAMGKRTRIPNVDFGELVSEGNMALLRSVEKFDVSRGFKFSTYACRAILKAFNRLATKTGRYRQRFPTEFNPDLERSDYDVMKHEMQREDSVDALRDILARNRAKLTDVEQTIVIERFALGTRKRKGRTLAEVGKMVGLTNERVRQIQNLALEKIRSALDEEYLVA